MITQKGWATKVMLSLFKKEASYDAGVTMSDANACTFTGFKAKVDWPDSVASDDDTISGFEFGTQQEILEQNVSLTISQERSHPNFVIGMAALTLGAVSSAKDGANDAYTHTITPSASNASNPSIQGEALCGGVQFAYKGLKADKLKISGDKGSYLKTECTLTGSGTRATSATAMAAENTHFSEQGWRELLSNQSFAVEIHEGTLKAMDDRDPLVAKATRKRKDGGEEIERKLRDAHMARLDAGLPESAATSAAARRSSARCRTSSASASRGSIPSAF